MDAQPGLFDGKTVTKKDEGRLNVQLDKVRRAMFSGAWKTLEELEREVEAPQASISARMRDLRKVKFGAYTIDRRKKAGCKATYEYRLRFPAVGAKAG
jgi:hypothetical protein